MYIYYIHLLFLKKKKFNFQFQTYSSVQKTLKLLSSINFHRITTKFHFVLLVDIVKGSLNNRKVTYFIFSSHVRSVQTISYILLVKIIDFKCTYIPYATATLRNIYSND